MSDDPRIPVWKYKGNSLGGPADRVMRFENASSAIAKAIIRNRTTDQGGSAIPVLVEGIRDEKTLRVLGFTGPIEKVNRGWDRSRLVAYLHSEYCEETPSDGGPPIILLMDWDRTGGRIQSSLRDRLMAMDHAVDEGLRNTLMRSMKPEGRTVESLLPHAESLGPLVQRMVSDME